MNTDVSDGFSEVEVALLLDPSISPRLKGLYLILKTYDFEKDHPTQKVLASQTGVGTRTIRAWLWGLHDRGLVDWYVRNGKTFYMLHPYANLRDVPEHRTRRKVDGFVYLVRCHLRYKIGASKAPVQRLKDLKDGAPYEIELLHVLPTADMYGLEEQLHEQFKAKRVRGEWFELDDSDVALLKTLEYVKGALSEGDIAIITQGELAGV